MWYCWAKEAEFYGRSDGSSVIIVQVNHRDIAGSNWVFLTREVPVFLTEKLHLLF